MTLVVVALLAVVGAILANAISSLIGDSVFARVRTTKARIVALGTVAVVAILVGAAAAWVQALSTSNKGQTAGPGELTQPVQTTVTVPSTVTVKEPVEDFRLQYCPEARSHVPPDSTGYGEVVSGDDGLQMRTIIANQTCGDTNYSPAVGAAYDQVVKAELWYGAFGGNLAPPDISFRFDVEQQMGDVAVIRGEIFAGDETLTSRAAVYVGRVDARLEYIGDTMEWRHNTLPPPAGPAYVTEVLTKASFGRPYLLTRVTPGGDGEGSVTALFRVIVPSIGIGLDARDGADWAQRVTTNPGSQVDVRILMRNLGNDPLREVTARVALPSGLAYVDDSVTVRHGDSEPAAIGDNGFQLGGVGIGDVPPGGMATVAFRVRVADDVGPSTELRLVGVTRWLGGSEYNNTVFLTVD